MRMEKRGHKSLDDFARCPTRPQGRCGACECCASRAEIMYALASTLNAYSIIAVEVEDSRRRPLRFGQSVRALVGVSANRDVPFRWELKRRFWEPVLSYSSEHRKEKLVTFMSWATRTNDPTQNIVSHRDSRGVHKRREHPVRSHSDDVPNHDGCTEAFM